MGLIIIGFLIGVIGIFLYKKDIILAQLFTIVGFMTFTISSIAALVGADVKGFESDYNNMKYETLVYRKSDAPENYIYLYKLDNSMKWMNDRIERNKKYDGNFWVGLFFDKRIGEYEKFDIKKELEKE